MVVDDDASLKVLPLSSIKGALDFDNDLQQNANTCESNVFAPKNRFS